MATEPLSGIALKSEHALIQFAADNLAPQVIHVEADTGDELLDARILLVPAGMQRIDMRPYLEADRTLPQRRKGTAVLTDPVSFVEHVKRFASEESAIFVDAVRTQLTCVFNYHPRGPLAPADWGDHRAVLPLALSPEWQAWRAAHGQAMSQTDFAAFIEDRALDLIDPDVLPVECELPKLVERLGVTLATSGEVIAASRGLRLRAEVNVVETVTLASGETELQYAETHRAQDGTTLKVPSAFAIAVPVFVGAPLDVLLARLRYRRIQGQPRVAWTVSLHQPDAVLLAALRATVLHVASDTKLPVYYGAPE